MSFDQYVKENRDTMRFGQIFCNFFDIDDPVLFNEETTTNAIVYFLDNYPEKWATVYEDNTNG